MSLETMIAAAQVAGADDLRQILEGCRAFAPARDKAATIDWQKVLEFIQQIMPLLLALLDLLPKKS